MEWKICFVVFRLQIPFKLVESDESKFKLSRAVAGISRDLKNSLRLILEAFVALQVSENVLREIVNEEAVILIDGIIWKIMLLHNRSKVRILYLQLYNSV